MLILDGLKTEGKQTTTHTHTDRGKRREVRARDQGRRKDEGDGKGSRMERMKDRKGGSEIKRKS